MLLTNDTIQNTKDWLDYTDVFLDPVLLILTFFLGYWISNWQVKRKEKKELNELYDYFLLYLARQEATISLQIKAIEELINELNYLKPFKTIRAKFIIQPIELLENLNRAQIVESFKFKSHPPVEAINLFVFINLCVENFKNFQDSHLNFGKRQNEILYKWNELIKDFHISKINSINMSTTDIINIPELMTLNRYYNDFCELKDPTPENVMEVCITPLKKYFGELGKIDHTNSYAIHYIPKLEQIRITYFTSEEYIRQQQQYLKDMLEVLKVQMEKSKIKNYITNL
ncbi:hypothetical protein [Fluviicola sp.]|uniref:hypothetical protein n=1 Tax=Fluviicola sp. TaxID=1917219 RepID=UPI0031E023EB